MIQPNTSLVDIVESQYNLTDEQQELLMEIRNRFRPNEIPADLCILYEVSGYEDEAQDPNWWDLYKDFAELGKDNLIREDKNEKLRS